MAVVYARVDCGSGEWIIDKHFESQRILYCVIFREVDPLNYN
jgi:hypothetical protein